MNNTTKVISGLLLATITVGWAAFASNSISDTWTTTTEKVENFWWKMLWHEWKWRHWWMWEWMMMWDFGWRMENELSTDEKTALESMTDTQKKEFFDKKRTENEAKFDAREAVIDKLLSWETLTDSDKIIVEEIKKERAEHKIKKAEMKEIRTLIDKQKNWETLTTDEQTKIDDFKAKMPWKNSGTKKNTNNIKN